MTKEQVNALREAGIQDKMIVDLIISETAEAVTPKPEPEQKSEPEQKPEPEQQPEPEKPEPEPENKPEPQTDKILAAIEKLTGAVLAHNVAGTGREDEPEKSADDIMGELLRGRK